MKRKRRWVEHAGLGARVQMTRHFIRRVALRFGLHDPADPDLSWGWERSRKHGLKLLRASTVATVHHDHRRRKVRLASAQDSERFLQVGDWIVPIVRHRRIEGLWVAVTIYQI